MTTTTYASTATYDDIAARIGAAERILVTSHQKPDGDAMGSVLALQRAITALGGVADVVLVGPVEPCLMEIAGSTPVHLAETPPADDAYDLALVVDTGAWSQLDVLGPWLKTNRAAVVGIDHHAHGDDVAPMRVIDPSAASTTQMLIRLLDAMAAPLTGGPGGIAEALFVGLATDSGWFRFGNAGAEAYADAARLLACGVDKGRLYQIIEESHRPARLRLEARALSSLELVADDAAAVMTLREADFEAAGGSAEDLTGMVNMPMIVGTIRVSVLLTEDGARTKISFRSKPARPGDPAEAFVDVNAFARRFGGGGHRQAAGARVDGGIDETKAAVIEALASTLAGT